MKNKKGLTLVEVVVAMGLFGMIMVTLFPAFLITNLMNNVSNEITDANYHAQTELEVIYNASKNVGSNPTLVLTNLGYTWDVPTSSYKRVVDGYDYSVKFTTTTTTEYTNLTNLIIEVSKPSTSSVAGKDRARLQLFLRFGS